MVLENKKVIYCKNCLYDSSHALGISFDNNYICSGCQIHLEKDSLNWIKKFDELKKIIKNYRSKKNYYDCIVPVDGSHDSFFIVHVVKNILKLNPLLVTYNKYFNTKLGIYNLSNLRIKFDSDILFQNVNPNKVKKITKYTLTEFGNIYWHCIAGQTVFPVQISIKYKIPLIIWGAHQGIEQVGMFSYNDEVEMTRRYRKDHDLFGKEAEDLITSYNNLNFDDIQDYIYPSFKEINSVGTRGIYLSNYIRWDPKKQNELMIKKYNYKTKFFNRTFDKYEYVDCFNYMGIHDILKQYKHGYSKVTDQASREIRFGRLKRKDAEIIVNYFQSQKIEYEDNFCEWIGIKKQSLYLILNSFKKNFSYSNFKDHNKKYVIKDNKVLKKINDQFKLTKNLNISDNDYITFGKGHKNLT
jgi:N-acetyl sugar amidotransferase